MYSECKYHIGSALIHQVHVPSLYFLIIPTHNNHLLDLLSRPFSTNTIYIFVSNIDLHLTFSPSPCVSLFFRNGCAYRLASNFSSSSLSFTDAWIIDLTTVGNVQWIVNFLYNWNICKDHLRWEEGQQGMSVGKDPIVKPGDLSLILGLTWWKERTCWNTVSPDLHRQCPHHS